MEKSVALGSMDKVSPKGGGGDLEAVDLGQTDQVPCFQKLAVEEFRSWNSLLRLREEFE